MINKESNVSTQRLKIDGGWIYHVALSKANYASTFFVPEPDKCRLHDEYLVKTCQRCLRAKPFIKEKI